MSRGQHLRRQSGFTVIELMITVGVLAVVIAAAVPSFQGMMANYQVRSAADALATSVMYARTETVKRKAAIMVKRAGNDWSAGWTVQQVGSDTLRAEALNGVVLSGLDVASFTLGRDGRIGSSYTVTICDEGNRATSRIVTISFSGQTRVKQGERCGQ